jgi:predicted metal-dependent enzyme (double-stranded beta helix superfamily)
MIDPRLKRFTDSVAAAVSEDRSEAEIAAFVAARLRDLIAAPVSLPAGFTDPLEDRYAMYPVYVAADGSFSVVAAVWGLGQVTPIHDHLTWGVVGVISGVELERRYESRPGEPPRLVAENQIGAGDVVVCCRDGDDVHAVACGPDSKVVAIHVYGSDIGTAIRHVYDPETGEAKPFTSAWCANAAEL